MASQFITSESTETHSFATLILEGRKRLRLTQEKFADFLGISVVTLRGWEQQEKNIVPNQAAQNYIRVALARPEIICEVLGKQLNRK